MVRTSVFAAEPELLAPHSFVAVSLSMQVGMGATLLDGVVLEPGSIVGAGAVVPPGEALPEIHLLPAEEDMHVPISCSHVMYPCHVSCRVMA